MVEHNINDASGHDFSLMSWEDLSDLSDTQFALMLQVQQHMHDAESPEPEELGLQEPLGVMLCELEQQHPQMAVFVKETLRTMHGMGI